MRHIRFPMRSNWELPSSIYYAASSGKFLATLRDKLPFPSSGFKNPNDRSVVPKRRQEITTNRCVITQKRAALFSIFCLLLYGTLGDLLFFSLHSYAKDHLFEPIWCSHHKTESRWNLPLQTTRKENNWKNEETLARTVVTMETERIKLVQPLMFMMIMMMMLSYWQSEVKLSLQYNVKI